MRAPDDLESVRADVRNQLVENLLAPIGGADGAQTEASAWGAAPQPSGDGETLQDGSPIVVDPRQKAVIDRLMSQSGDDQLGRAARAAYQRAWQNGHIKLGGD